MIQFMHCPTLSGLGERFHTATADIGLETHNAGHIAPAREHAFRLLMIRGSQ